MAGLRIAVLGDLHAGSFIRPTDWRRVFQQVQEQRPDLVLFVGDLINSQAHELEDLLPAFADLAAAPPPLGTFAVPGNHDVRWGGCRVRWADRLADHGVRVLVNEGIRLTHNGSPFWLAGVDDLEEGHPDLAAAMAGRDPDEPALLMAHHPDTFARAAAHRVDLTMSGHTHGGQIRLGPWVPLRHSKHGWLHGPFERDGHHLHVTAGIGVTLVPLRIGTRAEIPLLTLAPAAAGD